MNRDEIDEIYNRVLKILEDDTKGQYVDPDDLATAYNVALSKESVDIAEKIDDLMQELFPDNTLSLLVHAKRTAMKGDPVKALSLYERIEENEFESEHWEELPFASHCAIVAGKRKEGLNYYKNYIKHIKRPCEELELHFGALTVDLFTFGRDRKAIKEITEMTMARFQSSALLMIAANSMAMAENLPKAISYLREAAELDPMNPEIWMMLTRACLQSMDYDGMREACRYYMALCPETRDFEMLMIQADAYIGEGFFELSMESLRKCSHIRGLNTEQRVMLTLAIGQTMKGLGDSNKKIIDYLKRRIRIVGTDERLTKMIETLEETEE